MTALTRTFCALCLMAAGLAPLAAEAKSVKWSCVALDPLNPFHLICTGSTGRP